VAAPAHYPPHQPHPPAPLRAPVQVAFVGFAVQALVSRTGPIEGLNKHLADPFGHNITGYLTHLPEVLSGSF
jgi:hypothetical protein